MEATAHSVHENMMKDLLLMLKRATRFTQRFIRLMKSCDVPKAKKHLWFIFSDYMLHLSAPPALPIPDVEFASLVFILSHKYQYYSSIMWCIHVLMKSSNICVFLQPNPVAFCRYFSKTHNKTTQTVTAAEPFRAAAGSIVCLVVNYRLSQMHCWFTVGQSLAQTYSPIISPWHVIIISDLWRLLKVLT